MRKTDREQKGLFVRGGVLAAALLLAGALAAVGNTEPKREKEPHESAETKAWNGDEDALRLLRNSGVVAFAAKESAGEGDAADSYIWLHAKQREEREEMVPNEKVVYLTFDDGPSRNTEKILDILAEYDAKATFFLIGENMTEAGLEIAKRAVAEGHLLGLHTETHRYEKIYCSADAFLSDYNKLAKRFVEEFGECPASFRFPGGSCSRYINPNRDRLKEELKARGFRIYDWNVSGEDAVGTPTAASIKKNIFGKLYSVEEPIILLHDAPSNRLTVDVLPQILERLTEEGYQFRTLEEREPYQFPW